MKFGRLHKNLYKLDQKGNSLLDFLHFLKQEQYDHHPNPETIEAINEIDNDNGSLKTYSSVGEMFSDLGIGK
jgi:hypothetical protein